MWPQRRAERGPLRLPVVASASWLPAGALLSAHLAISAYGDHGLATAVGLGAATVAIFFGSTLAHGAAHVFVARAFGNRASARVLVFGDVLELETPLAGAGGLLVACAGPIVTVTLGGGLVLASSSTSGSTAEMLTTAAFANFALAAFNMLPGYPLDGGRIVHIVTGSPTLHVRAGRSIGLLAALAGIWVLLGAPGSVSDTGLGLWLILAGLFVIAEPTKPRKPVEPPRVPDIDGEVAGTWARPFLGRVDANDPVPEGGGPYAVSDNGRLAGVLPIDARPGLKTADVMVPWSPTLGIRATAPLADALERLVEKTTPVVVVVDESGVVRGLLDETAVRTRLTEV